MWRGQLGVLHMPWHWLSGLGSGFSVRRREWCRAAQRERDEEGFDFVWEFHELISGTL